MTRPALLDVNLLVALFDPDHVHHDLAHDWFADNRGRGWATCPLTENGFLRVLSNPKYGAVVTRVPDLVARLRAFCRATDHHFWPDAVSLRDDTVFDPALLAGPRQLTDMYLMGLARQRAGTLATFDRTINVRAIKRAPPGLLEVIAVADD